MQVWHRACIKRVVPERDTTLQARVASDALRRIDFFAPGRCFLAGK